MVVVSLDVADLTEKELQQEILLRRRIKKLAALLRARPGRSKPRWIQLGGLARRQSPGAWRRSRPDCPVRSDADVENVSPQIDALITVKLQSYISGCYGSLTSFNILFAAEEDQFKGSGGDSD